MMKWKVALFIGGGIILVVGWLVVDLLLDAGAFNSIEPSFAGSCEQVEGVVGSEDIVVDPLSKLAYLSYQDFRSMKRGKQPQPGAIVAYDLEKGGQPTKVSMDFAGPFHPHGLSFFRTEGGEARLFVVNHPDRTKSHVEIFAFDDATTLRHLRTVEGPEMISINDVAAVGPEQFYATNDAGTAPEAVLRVVETYLRLPWANVIFFNGERLSTVADGLRYANGIALFQKGRTVLVAETTGRKLSFYDRNERDGSLTLRSEKIIPSGLDNLSVDESGAIWIGAHPKMLDFLAHADDPSVPSPSQVLRVTVEGEVVNVEEVYLDDGREFSASSVAVPLGQDRFLIGAVFGSSFLDCTF